VNKHPSAVTRPPITAVNLVDFFLHTAIVIGDTNNATAVDKPPNQPKRRKKRRNKKQTKRLVQVLVLFERIM
jgi:hypothetical protein